MHRRSFLKLGSLAAAVVAVAKTLPADKVFPEFSRRIHVGKDFGGKGFVTYYGDGTGSVHVISRQIIERQQAIGNEVMDVGFNFPSAPGRYVAHVRRPNGNIRRWTYNSRGFPIMVETYEA